MSHGSSPASQGHALTEIDRSAAPVYVRWERQLPGLMDRLGVAPVGVVQVGAHIGQEVPALVRCGFRRLVMVEPNRDHSAALARELGRHLSGRPEPEGAGPPRRSSWQRRGGSAERPPCTSRSTTSRPACSRRCRR